jgi:hypothetical protein
MLTNWKLKKMSSQNRELKLYSTNCVQLAGLTQDSLITAFSKWSNMGCAAVAATWSIVKLKFMVCQGHGCSHSSCHDPWSSPALFSPHELLPNLKYERKDVHVATTC